MRFDSPQKRAVGIDIAPLVDVVFLLVIFFAVSTTFLESAGLPLELPESSSTAERQGKSLIVNLDTSGQLEFDGEVMDASTLEQRLTAAIEQADSKNVVLRADTHTQHGDVVKVIDLIRRCGATGLTVDARRAPVSGN